MAENTYLNNEISANGENLLYPRNMSYIADLKSDTMKYLNFLSTMSKFYRHETSNLPSFALEAPPYFSAVATENIWSLMGYYINDNAKGVTLYENGEIIQGYDASEVTAKNDKAKSNSLWQYDEANHKKYLDAVVLGEADTTQKIIALSEHLAKSAVTNEENRELIANSIAHVILERLGKSTEIPDRNIFQINISEKEIRMEEITNIVHKESQKVLDAFRDIAQENFKVNANPILAKVDSFRSVFETENDRINSAMEKLTTEDLEYSNSDDDVIDVDEEEENLSASEIKDNNNENKEDIAETQTAENVEENPWKESTQNEGNNAQIQAYIIKEDYTAVNENGESQTHYIAYNSIETGDKIIELTGNNTFLEINEIAEKHSGVLVIPSHDDDVPNFGHFSFNTEEDRDAFAREANEIIRNILTNEETREETERSDSAQNENNDDGESTPVSENNSVTEETLYKYYLNARPVSPGAQPRDFIRFDEEDKGGRYGAIYYNRKLSEEEIKEYELTPDNVNLSLSDNFAFSYERISNNNYFVATPSQDLLSKYDNQSVDYLKLHSLLNNHGGRLLYKSITEGTPYYGFFNPTDRMNFVQEADSFIKEQVEENARKDSARNSVIDYYEMQNKIDNVLKEYSKHNINLVGALQELEKIDNNENVNRNIFITDRISRVSGFLKDTLKECNDIDLGYEKKEYESAEAIRRLSNLKIDIGNRDNLSDIEKESGISTIDVYIGSIREEREKINEEKTAETQNIIGDNSAENIATTNEEIVIDNSIQTNNTEQSSNLLSVEDALARINGNSYEKNMFRDNVRAILTLKNLNNREATEEEKEIFKKYHGFGGLADAFSDKENWKEEALLLHEILTPAEYIEVRATVLNAYYTDPAIVRGIYNGISQMGFNGGRVLEPSMGIGAFLEDMPKDMRENSNIHGIELDSITGRIAKAIHTDANIQIKGFEKANYENASGGSGQVFDLTISNVPFGNYSVNDPQFNEDNLLIHDYFARKMLHETRPNGICALITTHNTMDKPSKSARLELYKRAELVRAIRLPNTAFKGAGTSVTTDILIFRKREKLLYISEASNNLPSWIETQPLNGDESVRVNSYFAEHPEYVLGNLKKTTNAYGFEVVCEGSSDNLEEQIANVFKGVEPFYVPEQYPEEPVDTYKENIHNSSVQIIDDEIIFFDGYGKSHKLEATKTELDRIKMILPVRDTLNELIAKQLHGVTDEEFEKLREKLNTTYDNYVKSYGRIRKSTALKKFLAEDNSYYRLLALEVYEKNIKTNRPEFKEKAPIFSKRVINTYTPPTSAENSSEALAISMQEKGRIDLPYMAHLTEKSNEELLKDLYGKEIFFDYSNNNFAYVTADEYLSGDVRLKLEDLEKRLENLNKSNENQAINEVLNTLRPLPSSKLPDAETDLDKLLDDYHENPENYTKRRHKKPLADVLFDDNEYSIVDIRLAMEEHNSTRERILSYVPHDGYRFRELNLNSIYENSPSKIIPYLFKGQEIRDFTLFNSIVGYSYKYNESTQAYTDSFKRVVGYYNSEQPTKEDYDKARIVTNFFYEIAEEYDNNPQKLKKEFRYSISQFIDKITPRFEDYIKNIEEKIQQRSVEIAEENAQNYELERENLLVGINALKNVIPKDLTAEDIHTEIGASWIPTEDYESFIEEVLGEYFKVKFSGKIGNGSWEIERAKHSTSNQSVNIYGTPNMNGIMIMQSLLNLTMPKINKKIEVNGEEKTVVDQEATLQVQQKAEEIKTAFNNWIWSDEERKERLVKYYNRHFNNIVPRSFNGDNLAFPAMSPNIRLRKHQKDAIARTLYGSNNALFAHSVGAGKTFEIVASIMESKRLGLAKKSLIVVPKHLTEQFGTEFLQLYPTANILVATAKEFKGDATKEFCAKIATGDWDAIIMSYEQFEKIPLSKERQEFMFKTEVQNILTGIRKIKKDEGSHFTVKAAEAYKKKIEARLAKLQKKDNREYSVNFEELGIDHLYVDEAHNYKNLFTFTKLANVSGVNNSDALKTQDMLFKCQYLNEIKNGHCNIVFATGTPISNTITELYTMQRYLVPERLEEEGFDYFDAWASQFGKIETVMELKPEGKGFQPRTRFSKFYNIPELLTMFKDFADIKMADDLKLDVPEATTSIETMKANEYQKDYVNQLAERAKAIRNGGVDPKTDNMLLITSEGRKLALDQRLINPKWPDDPNSKLNKCVKNVLDIHNEYPTEAQLIFCDISTPNNHSKKKAEDVVKANGLVYNDIKQKLIAGGLKEDEVAFIHDAKTEAAKDALFAKVRAGIVKVLIGSTSMMGTGTNVQDHLIASHDLDIPWRPSDLEQRKGRIVRQGNLNKKVKVFRYVTEGTFDAYLWQILENKQRFISQIMNSKSVERAAEDVDDATLSYAEIKAIATGNPLIKEKMEIDMQISKLKYAKSSYNLGQTRMKKMLEYLPKTIEKNKADLPIYENCANIINANMEANKNTDNDFSMEINGKVFTKTKDAIEALKAHKEKAKSFLGFKGKCYGMPFEISYSSNNSMQAVMSSPDGKVALKDFVNFQAPYTISTIKDLAERYVKSAKNIKYMIESDEAKLKSAQEEYGKPFPHEEEMENLISRSLEIANELDGEVDNAKIQGTDEDDIKASRENFIMQADIESLGKTLDVAYLSRAKKVITNASYSEKMENEIIRQLLQFKVSMKDVGNVILKYSPLQPEAENLKKRILKISNLMQNSSKIAAAR